VTGVVTAQKQGPAASAAGCTPVPGTNYLISNGFLRITLTTAQATLAAGDNVILGQFVEGPCLRELWGDVHSVSILCRSSVANLSLGLNLRDPVTTTHSLSKLCTLGAANSWTLITLPNLPVWPTGNFVITPGAQGYIFGITLACGSTYIPPANDVWQSGLYVGAVGQSNFFAQAVNSTFDVAFVQHEPGAVCSQLMDLPFTGPNGSLEACQRYFQKSYNYGDKPGTVTNPTALRFAVPAGLVNPVGQVRFPKIMSKTPTITGYSTNTGAINNVYDATNGADRAITSAIGISDNSFGGFNVTGGLSTIWQVLFHYTADTGW